MAIRDAKSIVITISVGRTVTFFRFYDQYTSRISTSPHHMTRRFSAIHGYFNGLRRIVIRVISTVVVISNQLSVLANRRLVSYARAIFSSRR